MTASKAELQSLLERVEKAEGPSRQLDGELALALGIVPVGFVPAQDGMFCEGYQKAAGLSYGLMWGKTFRVPEYTDSVDGAVTLVEKVLPERDFVEVFYDCGSWFAKIGIHDPATNPDWQYWRANDGAAMDSPALALCAALLRALIARAE